MNHHGNKLNWAEDRWTAIDHLVHESAKEMQTIRPLLRLYGTQGDDYVTTVDGHEITEGSSPLAVRINQRLTVTTISCDFVLQPSQFTDEATANSLATEAVYRVTAAEEAVMLLGKAANGFVKKLGVKVEALNDQKGLFAEGQAAIDNKTTVLGSIIQAITELGNKGRFGKYGAIVSLDLYQQAMQPRQNPFDAQIYEIRPLLVKDGFLYSQAVPTGTGVVFSLSGDGIKLNVPVDARVECAKEETDVTLQVVEQMRLLIDVPDAVAPLRTVKK